MRLSQATFRQPSILNPATKPQDLHKTQGSLRQRDGELKQSQMEMERYKRLEGEAKEKLTASKRKIEERDGELSDMNVSYIGV